MQTKRFHKQKEKQSPTIPPRAQAVIDADVLTWERACLHPGINTKSIAISMADFKSVILPNLGHEPTVIEITGQTET